MQQLIDRSNVTLGSQQTQRFYFFTSSMFHYSSIPIRVLFYPNETWLGPCEIIIYRSELEFYLNKISLDQSEKCFIKVKKKTFDPNEIILDPNEKYYLIKMKLKFI